MAVCLDQMGLVDVGQCFHNSSLWQVFSIVYLFFGVPRNDAPHKIPCSSFKYWKLGHHIEGYLAAKVHSHPLFAHAGLLGGSKFITSRWCLVSSCTESLTLHSATYCCLAIAIIGFWGFQLMWRIPAGETQPPKWCLTTGIAFYLSYMTVSC